MDFLLAASHGHAELAAGGVGIPPRLPQAPQRGTDVCSSQRWPKKFGGCTCEIIGIGIARIPSGRFHCTHTEADNIAISCYYSAGRTCFGRGFDVIAAFARAVAWPKRDTDCLGGFIPPGGIRLDMVSIPRDSREGFAVDLQGSSELLTPRVSPPAHPETMPRRADGRREE